MKFPEKIVLKQGDLVKSNIDTTKGTGKICGKTVDNVLTVWIVELLESTVDKKVYPFSHIGVPHTLLTKIDS